MIAFNKVSDTLVAVALPILALISMAAFALFTVVGASEALLAPNVVGGGIVLALWAGIGASIVRMFYLGFIKP